MGSKNLFIEFSNGDYQTGTFYLYKENNNDVGTPNYLCRNVPDVMYYIPGTFWIKQKESDVLYTISSIVKILSMSEDEVISYTRDKKLNSIL
jgi:hypothetical protein